jgi:hypothetical protein
MASLRIAVIGWCALGLGAGAARAAPAAEDAGARDALALAAAIDRHIAAGWEAGKVQPAPPASDAEFLRRVYLDLAGRIPSATEARQFLDDPRPDKRQRVIDRLLAGPTYVNHFTNVWRNLLVPEVAAGIQARIQRPSFEGWLRKQLAENAGYDKLVRELLTAPVGAGGLGKVPVGFGGDAPSPAGFFFAKEMKPENLAASTTRIFLGVRLECAQCHNHPFADWKREQFWQFAAFFAGLRRQGMGEIVQVAPEVADRHELTIPDTNRTVSARYLDGSEPAWRTGASTRETLADWVTRADNPYFARAAVNRTWAYFFGTGLIEPVDEIAGTDAEPSHPELLDELARQFAAQGFDLKFLIRSITNSKTYQLSSAVTDASQGDPRKFARMPLRGLTPEQLYDSVAQATGYQEARSNLPPGVFINGAGGARDDFLARFSSQNDKSTDYQTSILHALALMNGRLVGDATDLERSELLAAVLDAPFLDTAGRVEVMYLATLTRRPTDREVQRLTKFIDERTAAGDGDRAKRRSEALADVFWALLNSGEFLLNH